MTASVLEIFLARLYAEPALLQAFLTAPEATVAAAGLDADDAAALCGGDLVGLQMAARSFAAKRRARCPAGRRKG
jgi:hypothetical protein